MIVSGVTHKSFSQELAQILQSEFPFTMHFSPIFVLALVVTLNNERKIFPVSPILGDILFFPTLTFENTLRNRKRRGLPILLH
jgi:hypothetical protein